MYAPQQYLKQYWVLDLKYCHESFYTIFIRNNCSLTLNYNKNANLQRRIFSINNSAQSEMQFI